MSRDHIKYEDIVARLNDMASRVAEDCIPNGRVDKNYWRGDLNGKISVHISGSRVGMVGAWQGQFGDKMGGNLIRLIELAYGCKSHGEAVRLAKRKYLGIEDRPLTDEEKRRWAEQQRESERRAADRAVKAEQDRREREESVRGVWKHSQPITGTLAETYLLGRGIDITKIGGKWPGSLRFAPVLSLGRNRHPALICGVQAADRRLISIWRIFLDQSGKVLVDEDGKKLKLGLGEAGGGAVRLGPESSEIIVTEGVETAFGAGMLTGWKTPVWAALSTSGMIGLKLPPSVRKVHIYGDGDRHRFSETDGAVRTPPGEFAALRLQSELQANGVEAVVHIAPEGSDWLDVWNSQ